MMKKFTLLVALAVFASYGWAQSIVFEESLTDFSAAGDPPPAGWTESDEDGQTVSAFYTDQGIFTSSSWEGVSFGQGLRGYWSCASFIDSTDADPADDWLMSPPIDLTANSNATINFDLAGIPSGLAGVPPTSVEVYATNTIAGTAPAPSDFTGASLATLSVNEIVEFEPQSIALPAPNTGDTVYIAIVNVTTEEGDIAGVSNFQITSLLDDDLELTSINAVDANDIKRTDYLVLNRNYSSFTCGGFDNTIMEIEVTNTGINDITSFSASFVIDSFGVGGPSVTESVTLPSPLTSGQSTTYTFTTPVDLSVAGEDFYFINGWVDLSGDQNLDNDTLGIDDILYLFTPEPYEIATEGPFVEDFEQFTFAGNSGTFNADAPAWSWTTIDQNNDGFGVSVTANIFGNARSGDFTLHYEYNSDDPTESANEFAFGPCIELEAGKGYQMKGFAAAGADQNGNVFPERFRFIYNTSLAATGVTTIGGLNDVTSENYVEYASSFIAPADGSYYLGVNVNSDADQFFLNIDDIELTEFDEAPSANIGIVGNDDSGPGVFIEYCDGEITASNNSTGVVDEVTIDWGDGTPVETFSGPTLTHTYATIGTYTVTLTASNVIGSDDATAVIDYTPAPQLDANFVVASGPDAQGVITILVDDYPDCYNLLWDFGDGTTANGPQTSYDYGSDGEYTIQLTVQGPGTVDQFSTTVNVATGINNVDFAEALSLFPSPANSELNVTFELNKAQNTTLNIISIDGKVLSTRVVENATGVNEIFNVSNLATGVYMLQIQNDEGIATERFVVDKK